MAKRSEAELSQLRQELHQLRARYDHGGVQPGVYKLIRDLEIKIAWKEHRSAMRGK